VPAARGAVRAARQRPSATRYKHINFAVETAGTAGPETDKATVFEIGQYDIPELQNTMKNAATCIAILETGELPANTEKSKRIVLQASYHVLIDGVLYKLQTPRGKYRELQGIKPLLILTQALVPLALQNFHDMNGHAAVTKTYDTIHSTMDWQNSFADVNSHRKEMRPVPKELSKRQQNTPRRYIQMR